MSKPTRTRVVTVTCPACKQEIYSRAHHDFRSCKCKKTHIDGGRDYTKIGFDPDFPVPVQRIRYVKATRSDLYKDWNTWAHNFGTIEPNCPSKKDKSAQKRTSRKTKSHA